MIAFLLLLITHPFSQSYTFASNLCEQPYATVCESEPFKSELKKRRSIILELSQKSIDQALLPTSQGGCGVQLQTGDLARGFSESELKRRSVLDSDRARDILCYGRLLQQNVLHYSKLNESALSLLLDQARNQMKAALNLQTHLARSTRERMSSVVSQIKYFHVGNIDQLKVWSDDASYFFAACGDDLTFENAFSADGWKSHTLTKDPETSQPTEIKITQYPVHALVFCPANFLITQNEKLKRFDPLAPTYHRLAHELGHQIDIMHQLNYQPTTESKSVWADSLHTHKKVMEVKTTWVDARGKSIGPTEAYDFVPAYADFLTCHEQYYRDDLIDGPEDHDAFGTSVGTTLSKNLKHVANFVEMHSPELIGDYWGTQNLARIIGETRLSPELRLEVVQEALGNLCSGAPAKSGKSEDFDPGIHPSRTFRIEAVFRTPAIRNALGCTQLSGLEKPNCNLDGASD